MEPTRDYCGIPIAIENVMGSTRSGVGGDGKPWTTVMTCDYGDIVGVRGADGDDLDVFLGPCSDRRDVYIVNQVDPSTGEFDEHKVMLGFPDLAAAKEAYLSNYEDGWGGLGGIVTKSFSRFCTWLAFGDTEKPVDEDKRIEGVQDCIQISQEAGQVIILDDAEGAPLRVSLLASLAGIKNKNARVYSAPFLRGVVPHADAECKARAMYGEEPHPAFNGVTGQYLTDSTREIWRSIGWHCDAAGNAWSTVEIDETTEKGRRVGTKVRRGEKIPCSVRWFATKSGRTVKMTDGTTAALFDADHVPFVTIAALDHVPNPAFTQAGKMADSVEATFAMLDATDSAAVEAARYVPEAEQTTEPAALATEEQSAQPSNTQTTHTEEQSLTDATGTVTDATNMENEKENAGAGTVQGLSDADREVLAEAKAIIADKKAEAAKVQSVAAVKAFADAVAARTADGVDLTRFDDKQVTYIAKGLADAETVEKAREIVADRIEMVDAAIASAAVGAGARADVRGETVQDAGVKVEIVKDAGDKAVEHVRKGLHDAFDRHGARHGFKPDSKLRETNREFVDKLIDHNFPGDEGKRAIVDSALAVVASDDKERARHMADAQQFVASGRMGVVDAASNTMASGSLLNQPIYSSVLLERMYWDLEALQLAEGFGPDSFMRAPGSLSEIGSILRVPTVYIVPATHDFHQEFDSLEVAESTGIPEFRVEDSWQDFGTRGRKLGFSISKEAEIQMSQGPLRMDLVARNFYEGTNEFRRSTDLRMYSFLNSASDEISIGTVATGAAETVAQADITDGNVQDGITYGATVVAIAQPACAGRASGATRNTDNAANASANNAYRTPIVRPRKLKSAGATGAVTEATSFGIVAKKGATVLVQGYLGADGNILSYPGTTADFAVDYARGKFLFNAHSTVAHATTTLTLAYTYTTNFDAIQLVFAGGTFPNNEVPAYYYNRLFERIDQTAANMASYPNFAPPNINVHSQSLAVKIKNAAIFYNLLSPAGTERRSGNQYATRGDIDYIQTNAQVSWGNDVMLLGQRGALKYGASMPWRWEGPYPKYDSNGNLTDEIAYYGHEFAVIDTPLPRNQAGTAFNPKFRKAILY